MPRLCPTRKTRRAFTLMELLIVMMIIALMATMLIAVLTHAREMGRSTRTRAIIGQLNELVVLRWDEYQSRPIPLRAGAGWTKDNVATMRLAAIRELQRMELPDRKSDVQQGPRTPGLSAPAVWRAYRRIVAQNGGFGSWTRQYQGSECLYMIVASMNDEDGSPIEFFKPSEIGDKDGDGMLELWDAWGNPISFLRWAPGYRSPSQLGDLAPTRDGDAGKVADPFDINLKDRRWRDGNPSNDPFALYPLIYSAGPDKEYDVHRAEGFNYVSGPTPNDPYAVLRPQIGTQRDDNGNGYQGFGDNIDNHYGVSEE